MRPIIFDAESVNAILRGCKTQTRRVVNPQPPDWLAGQIDSGFRTIRHIDGDTWGAFVQSGSVAVCRSDTTIRCPYGKPGERLWVREATWQKPDAAWLYHCAADRYDDAEQIKAKGYRKVPAMLMRRELSRITLEIVSVRVERLQDITEADAVAEGTKCLPGRTVGNSWCERECFAHRWDRINGKRAPWESSPWVWVIEFRRVEQCPE